MKKLHSNKLFYPCYTFNELDKAVDKFSEYPMIFITDVPCSVGDVKRNLLDIFSDDIMRHINKLVSVINALAFNVALDPGEAYIVNNRRALHGRTSFEGNRTAWRFLTNSKMSLV